MQAHEVPADELRHLPRRIEVDGPPDRQEYMQPGFAGRFHDRLERHAVQQLAQTKGHLLALLERHGVELGLVSRRLLAGIDVRIDVEHHIVRVVQHRLLEGLERARIVRCLGARIGRHFGARVPDVELERARLRKPQQCRQVVAQQVVVRLVPVIGKHRDRLGERRPLLAPVLLVEALAMDAVGHADHGERPVGEMRQHERRHLRDITQQVALGERRLLERGVGGPVHAVEMREPDLVRADGERERGLDVVQLPQDGTDLIVFVGHARLARHLAAHLFRFEVVAKAQEHRRTQEAVVGPVLEFHFRHYLRLDPDRRAVQLRLFGEGG